MHSTPKLPITRRWGLLVALLAGCGASSTAQDTSTADAGVDQGPGPAGGAGPPGSGGSGGTGGAGGAVTRDIGAPTPDAGALDAAVPAAGGADGAPPGAPDAALVPPGRLVPVWAVGPDVARADETTALLLDWFDTTLDMECFFLRGPDGTLRCMPVESGGLHVFSTPTCEPGTDALALLASRGAPLPDCTPRLTSQGYVDTVGDAPNALQVFRITGPSEATTESHGYVQTYFGDCVPRPAPPPPPDPGPMWVYCALEDVPLTDLVAGMTDTSPLGGARLEMLTAEGTRAPRRLLHAEHDVRLVPDGHTEDQLVADAPAGIPACLEGDPCGACEVPAGCLHPDSVGAGVIRLGMLDDCVEPVFLLGAAGQGAQICGGGGGDSQDQMCFAIGGVLASVPYERIRRGEGRLRPEWVALGGLPAMPTEYFWDDVLGTTCYADVWTSESAPCLPASGRSGAHHPRGWRDVYAASTRGHCEQPLGSVYLATCGEAATTYRQVRSAWFSMVATQRPLPETVYAGVGAAGDETHNCEPLDAEGGPLFDAVPVDPAEFAVVTRRRGP